MVASLRRRCAPLDAARLKKPQARAGPRRASTRHVCPGVGLMSTIGRPMRCPHPLGESGAPFRCCIPLTGSRVAKEAARLADRMGNEPASAGFAILGYG